MTRVELALASLAFTDARIQKATAGARHVEARQIIRGLSPETVPSRWPELPARLPGVTISSVNGFGRKVGRDKNADLDPAEFGTVNMTKVECVVDDEMLDDFIEIIHKAAHTGLSGDGKIVI